MANSYPDINMVGVALSNRSQPTYSTKYKAGNRYGATPAFVSKTSAPTGTRRVSLSGSWIEDSVMTLKTNGAVSFGDVGPNLLMYLDASKLPLGPIDSLTASLPSNSIGQGVTFDYPDVTSGLKFQVVTVPGLPGNKGIVSGAVNSTLNDTNTPRLWCHHPASPRNLEVRCNYWPQAQQDAATPYLTQATGPAGTRTWQEKGVWNMAGGDYGSTDTNFFLGTWSSWVGAQMKIGASISSNSIPTTYGLPNLLNNNSTINLQFAEPLTTEYAFDQNACNDQDGGKLWIRMWGVNCGLIINSLTLTGLRLALPAGPVRVIDTFTYPGFMRGFNVPLNMNRFDAFVYKANGPGAFCRVMISNNANYKQSTISTLQIVKNWTRDQIDYYVRGGWFDLANLKGNYLNIVGADNNQITYIRL